jgi:hypothetical protein
MSPPIDRMDCEETTYLSPGSKFHPEDSRSFSDARNEVTKRPVTVRNSVFENVPLIRSSGGSLIARSTIDHVGFDAQRDDISLALPRGDLDEGQSLPVLNPKTATRPYGVSCIHWFNVKFPYELTACVAAEAIINFFSNAGKDFAT